MRSPRLSAKSKLYVLLVLTALLSGCVQIPVQPTVVVEPDADARVLIAEGRFLEAAQAFTALATTATSPQREAYQLHAANAFLRAGDRVAARTAAQAISPVGVGQDLLAERNLILGELALHDNDPAGTLAYLSADSTRPKNIAGTAQYHLLRAGAFESLGQHLTASRERMIADPLLPAYEQTQNRHAIWLGLVRSPLSQLNGVELGSPSSLEGWVTLALIARRLITDPVVFETAVTQWGVSFPNHPGTSMLDTLRNASLVEADPPSHIAVLLPLEGKFARAATAIRDGFLAAWYQEPNVTKRPEVSFWNTEGRLILKVYAQAVAAGADVVVGPLDKPSVTTLARSAPLSVNTLSLNVPDNRLPLEDTQSDTTKDDVIDEASLLTEPQQTGFLYHFSLSHEEEAERVAKRAWGQGYASAALITPAGAWGDRISNAFTDAWVELGGDVAESWRFDNNAIDMSGPVSTLLAVNLSKERAKELRRNLGVEIEHTPRRRKDIDFIFMVASPKQARLLRPQLLFHHASDLPVFATSHIYSGIPDAAADVDIDGVQFGDMPWVLKPGGTDGRLRVSTESAWRDSFSRFVRYYAFGADAYKLLPHLGTLRAQPYIELPGETGSLSVNADNRIRRGLSWAQFVEGVPQQLELNTLEEE